ncbi:hypothetical protein Gbem_1050 [Citrifermentans bemidjiense Bem]|uniref:Uncharacterized protein n=1 Tax=Citrifermentans bemidjiense (strain ATCC BAA-1014 / DSM 16622 / JCM 12645 / Bem) TaxID=404380 RepID=B5EGK6_CITBB|nr:hypothetical protein [Citrifermentans bemidjiense]ACH38071.1 hypothetical protein Gbem_1050 [Citrifermentans bemidjiense Bem]
MTESSHKKRCCDETGSLCASLFLHGVLFLVLSSSSHIEPPLGAQTRLDILWFTPIAVPPPLQATPQAAPAATVKPRPQRQRPLGAKRPEAPPEALPAKAVPAAPMVLRIAAPSSPHPAPEHGTRPEQRASLAVKAPASPPPKPPTAPTRAAAPAARTAPPAEAPPVAPERKDAEPAQVATEAHPQMQAAQESPPQMQASRERPQPAALGLERAAPRPRPEPAVKRQPDKAQQQRAHERGTSFAALQGDLKLTVAGGGVKLSIAFREFPRSRRDRTPTKAEARRLQQVAPVTAKRDERTREAVIERAGEGVYIFSAEPETASAAQASFTLTIYEAGKREKKAAIGTRTLQKKTVVARILMPEGVLWDDDSAFTGSLEDSDSTTKFNAQTGLYWKEYAD